MKKLLLLLSIGLVTLNSCTNKEDKIKEQVESKIIPLLVDPLSYAFYSMERIDTVTYGESLEYLYDSKDFDHTMIKYAIIDIEQNKELKKLRRESVSINRSLASSRGWKYSLYNKWYKEAKMKYSKSDSLINIAKMEYEVRLQDSISHAYSLDSLRSTITYDLDSMYIYAFKFKSLTALGLTRLATYKIKVGANNNVVEYIVTEK